MRILLGILFIIHGLVHMWFVTLSQEWVSFQTEMGWNGDSWILSGLFSEKSLRLSATILYGLSTLVFVLAGIGVLAGQDWGKLLAIIASSVSLVTIVLFWDGNTSQLVEKGAIGVGANILTLLFFLLNPNF